jgi:hypothetical protein
MNLSEEKRMKIESAKCELTELKAIKILLKNNLLAAEIHIAGMVMGTCYNDWLLPVIDKQIQEIKKFLNNKPNLWE